MLCLLFYGFGFPLSYLSNIYILMTFISLDIFFNQPKVKTSLNLFYCFLLKIMVVSTILYFRKNHYRILIKKLLTSLNLFNSLLQPYFLFMLIMFYICHP